MAILIFLVVLVFGLMEFVASIYHFLFPEVDEMKHNFQVFIRGILGSFEIFFLSPIALLIISSFKRIIIKMYPLEVKVHPTEALDMISEIDTKKTFISSLIGVTSTFILGQLIECFGGQNGHSREFTASKDFYMVLGVAILFLVIQVGLYYILSSHAKHEHKE